LLLLSVMSLLAKKPTNATRQMFVLLKVNVMPPRPVHGS
jgi:hypothetical protein